MIFLSSLMMPLASSEPPSGNITQLSATPIKDGEILSWSVRHLGLSIYRKYPEEIVGAHRQTTDF